MEGEKRSEKTNYQEIIVQCLGWHDEFDQRWGKDSFHNRHHIEATMKAASTLVAKAMEGNDPLGILQDLKDWNDKNPSSQVTNDELPTVVSLAFALHDLGNIASGLKNGKITFLDKYQANGAEERSQEIAEEVINNSKLSSNQKQRWLPLIKHLIGQTTYQPQGQEPFGLFARVADQIGNGVLNIKRDEMVDGLLNEMVGENPDATFKPYFFYNFVHERFPQLVPDEATREKILGIWQKNLPPKKENLPSKEIKIRNWLENNS